MRSETGRLRRFLAIFCLLALLLSLSGPVSAARTLYFTAINETVVDLSDSTMPTWSNGVLYVPYSVFDGSNTTGISFNISFSYNRTSGLATLFNTRQFLTFDLNNSTCYNALTGESLNGRAILRNGQVYVPVALVCRFFDLTYSVISIPEGYMVRVRNSASVLSDAVFVDAAVNSIAYTLREYNQANQSSPAPGVLPPSAPEEPEESEPPAVQEPEEPDQVPIYLGFRCEEDSGLSSILDLLETEGLSAVFFFSAEQFQRQDDLLYRILGSGHSVGLLAEGSTAAATQRLLEEGNQALERAAYTRTAIALVPEAQRDLLKEAGWVCWNETVSSLPTAEDSASSFANGVLRQIAGRSQTSYLTLDTGSESARVLSTLLQRLESRSYAVSVPLETRL